MVWLCGVERDVDVDMDVVVVESDVGVEEMGDGYLWVWGFCWLRCRALGFKSALFYLGSSIPYGFIY